MEHNAIADHYRKSTRAGHETLFQMARSVNVAPDRRTHTIQWTEDLLQPHARPACTDWYGFLGPRLKD